MVYIKYALMVVFDLFMTIFTVIPAAIIVPIFTRSQEYGKSEYTWGWIWGTYDNPPQGDKGFVRRRSPFLNVTTGFKGYINRAVWMVRNPLYGLAKRFGVKYDPNQVVEVEGNTQVSDKFKVPGSFTAKVFQDGKLVAFEYYLIKPWSETRDLRMRIGWKIMTDKFERNKFAQFVFTINPFDGYGDD